MGSRIMENFWSSSNGIRVRSLLDIESIIYLPRKSIEFVLAFPQAELYFDVFVELTLGMGVDRIIGEWVLNLNRSIYGPKQASKNGLIL